MFWTPPLPSNSRTQKSGLAYGLELKGCRVLTTPLPSASEATIFSCSLTVVTFFRHCLPVTFIPKQIHVTAMRFDVVNYSGRLQLLCAFQTVWTLTQWM